VKIHLNRFLRRVRIHGGEFDTSARAMYRVRAKRSLITYEKAFSTQAEPRIVRGSTIERKKMSTKTTFKRITLVTVAALGLSLVAAAPSNAGAVFAADNVTVVTSSSATTVGTAATTVVSFQAICLGAETHTVDYSVQQNMGAWQVILQSVPVGIPTYTAPTLTARASDSTYPYVGSPAPTMIQAGGTDPSAAALLCGGSGAQTGFATASFTPSKAGVYTFKIKGVFQAYAEANWTVVATAKTVGKSSAFIGTSVGANDTATADATVSVTAASSTTAKARIDVASIYGTTGNDTATAADAPLVVVTTTKGLVSKTNDFFAGAKTVTTAAAVDADPSYWVFANGDVGEASITITVGGVLLATKTVTFTGVATALVATLTSGQAKYVGVLGNTTLAITSTDAAGATVSNPSGLTVKSSDTSVATAVQTSNTLTTISGVKAGTAVITVTDPAAGATAATYTVTVKAVRPTTAPTITFDKTAYNVGEVITMTVNADMADSATASALFTAALVTSAPVTTVAGATALSTSSAAHAIASGVATYKFYAPAVSGTFTVTGTTGGTVDITTAATVTKTVDILNPGVDAATVAAEAAEAAAQDATDAALDATTAAEAAGALAQEAVDLVTELSAEVTKLMTALKAQIDSLTTLVTKLIASTAAIAKKLAVKK